jgi:hypothetical protein
MSTSHAERASPPDRVVVSPADLAGTTATLFSWPTGKPGADHWYFGIISSG